MGRPYFGGGSIDKPKAPVSSADQVVVLPYAVLRAAAWPVELAVVFAAPSLASSAGSVLAAERALVERRAAVVARLHAAIPRAADGRTRAYLLALKRRIHGTTEPLRSVSHHVLEPDVAAVIGQEHEQRCALAERRSKFERQYATVLEDQLATLQRLTSEQRLQR